MERFAYGIAAASAPRKRASKLWRLCRALHEALLPALAERLARFDLPPRNMKRSVPALADK